MLYTTFYPTFQSILEFLFYFFNNDWSKGQLGLSRQYCEIFVG